MSEPGFSRMRRVDSIVHHVIATEVEQLKDPRLELVTITGVTTAPNLRRATVFFSCLDFEKADDARRGLEAAAPRLRRILGSEVRMKYTPELEFELDGGVAAGARIDEVLQEIARRRRAGEEE